MRKLLLAVITTALLAVPGMSVAELIPPVSEGQALEYEQRSIDAQQNELQKDIGEVTREIASDEKKIAQAPALPAVYMVSLSLIPQQERSAVQTEAAEYLTAGRPDKAASVIGRALGTANQFSLFFLGNYCLTALKTAGDSEAQIKFLSGFMRGYNKAGLFIVSKNSVKLFSAFSMKRGEPWKGVPAGALSAGPDERLYRGQNMLFIPFEYGSKFIVDIIAKNGGTVRVWKIVPEGVAAKSWPGGNWEKEITVVGKGVPSNQAK